VPTTDLAAPERWLESQRRSRSRRFGAARRAARRRLGGRSTVALLCVMALGSGAALANQTADVQRKLGIAADGINCPQTKRAVKRFQRAHGLVVDGIVGPQTLAALGLSARTATRHHATASARSVLARIAECESGGDPTAVSSSGTYRGKYQFSRATWRAMGGHGDPARAPEAVQDRLAARLFAARGTSPWPVCGGGGG
jgi:peptidoglycan hydrolase-like protein with peptidoglycan-binding domain